MTRPPPLLLLPFWLNSLAADGDLELLGDIPAIGFFMSAAGGLTADGVGLPSTFTSAEPVLTPMVSLTASALPSTTMPREFTFGVGSSVMTTPRPC